VLPTFVYNLTLERDNAYYANGILVFNCLTFAEPVTVQPILRRGRPKTEDYNPYREVDSAPGGGYNPYR